MGLCALVIMGAILGQEGWRDGDRRDSSDSSLGLAFWGYGGSSIHDVSSGSLSPTRQVDATPTLTMAPPKDDASQLASQEEVSILSGDREDTEGSPDGIICIHSECPTHPACGSTWACFFWGYYDADGQETERINAMIQCESSWRINPPGYHYGLAQFDPGTWWAVSAITGLSDWLDPYQQGYNVAVWSWMVSPGTTAGWPSCWWAWGY